MNEQRRIGDGLVLEQHQCRWQGVLGDEPGSYYYRCELVWGDGTPCSQTAVEPLEAFAQWVWKDETPRLAE